MGKFHQSRAVGAIAATLLAITMGQAVAPAQRDTRQALLAVSEGTSLLPIARHTGAGWINTWPEPADLDVPVPPLEGIPATWLGERVPRRWTLSFTTGGTTPLDIARSERSGGCIVSPRLVVAAPPTPPAQFDMVHVGLAVAGRPMPVDAIRPMTAEDADWPAVESAVRALVALHARRIIDAYADEALRARLTPGRVAAAAVTLDWAFAPARVARPVAIAFEASKHFAEPDQNVYRAIVAGWLVRQDDGAFVAHDVTEHFSSDPDAADLPQLVPLGIVRPEGRDVWVQEAHPGEVTTFRLLEVTRGGVRTVLTIDAGGC